MKSAENSQANSSDEIRLIHTSDWHLGRSHMGQNLIGDQSEILEQIVDLIDAIQPHAVLISGDIFDRSTPPEAAVRLFDHFLQRVVLEKRRQVFLIPGNHDSAERVGFASRLLRGNGLTIFARAEDAFEPVRIQGDGKSEAWIFGIPFLEPILVGEILRQKDIRSPDAALRAICAEIEARFKPEILRHAVLLSHAFVVGGEASESERDLFVGGSSAVDAGIFKSFAYTALGHLHKPQGVGERIRYSGSPLAYSKSEVTGEKSITEVRLKPDGTLQTQVHELNPRRRLRVIEGELATILARAAQDPRRDDYILIELTDRGPVLDAHAQIRQHYPHLLNVTRKGGYTPETLPSSVEKHRNEISDLELLSDFFFDTTGEPMSADEQEAVIETLRELEAET